MNLDQFTRTYRPIIETYLTDLFQVKLDDPRQTLNDAMGYSLSAKAKRIRPLLTIAVFGLYRPLTQVREILPLAAAIEIIHTYSLIHDDLPSMDNDDFRRGLPTCHKKFGENTAILAGDTLNTFAWELLAKELPAYFPANQVLLVIQKLANALGLLGMAGGQMMDLNATPDLFSESYLIRMHQLKTGALLTACAELPGLLVDAPQTDIHHLYEYGKAIGLLFQIVDDILDVTGTPEILGKTQGKDQDQHKLTYTALWGLEKARLIADQTAISAKTHLQSLSKDAPILSELVDYILNRNF